MKLGDLRHGNDFMIVYATFIDSEGFRRLSIAHELGHYFLEKHIDHVLPKDGAHQSHAGFTSADSDEQEPDKALYPWTRELPSASFEFRRVR